MSECPLKRRVTLRNALFHLLTQKNISQQCQKIQEALNEIAKSDAIYWESIQHPRESATR